MFIYIHKQKLLACKKKKKKTQTFFIYLKILEKSLCKVSKNINLKMLHLQSASKLQNLGSYNVGLKILFRI